VRAAWERRLGPGAVDRLAAPMLATIDRPEAGWSDQVLQSGRHFHRTVGVLIRTRYLDDAVSSAVAGGVRQIVNLGAGFDTRPFRLDLPSDTVAYDVDLPEVIDLKREMTADLRLVPRCRHVGVATDLASPFIDELTAVGLDLRRPVLWIGEGLFQSLPSGAVQWLFLAIAAVSVLGSRVAATSVTNPPAEAGWLARNGGGTTPWTVEAVATEDYTRWIGPMVTVPLDRHGEAGSLFTAVRTGRPETRS
jgi:methyltransferase (TIGR00027 family)